MNATPMDIARSRVAHQMASNRAWHQPAFLVMNSAVNFADQMATNAAEKGNAEMYDAYAAVTAYLSESRDRLTARYPLVNLDDLAADAYRPTPAVAPQDHGPLAATLSERTLAKVLSRPAYVPRETPSLVELDRREAAERALAALVEWRKAGDVKAHIHATVALRKAADEYIAVQS